MGLKSKVLAAAATLALVGGTAAFAGTAGAATPSCGSDCLDLFARDFGTHSHPNFVLDVQRQAARVGQPIILYRATNSDRAEDFSAEDNGNVSDFYAAGMVSPALALHYGCTPGTTIPGPNGPIQCSSTSVDDPAFEIEYAPLGQESGLCVGVAGTAFSGEHVTLQPCGASSKTVWVVDANDSPSTISHGYLPLINGSDSNFSHPFVLTYPLNGYPTDSPRPVLQVRNLTGFSQGNTPLGNPIGNVNTDQLWGAITGILH